MVESPMTTVTTQISPFDGVRDLWTAYQVIRETYRNRRFIVRALVIVREFGVITSAVFDMWRESWSSERGPRIPFGDVLKFIPRVLLSLVVEMSGLTENKDF